MTENGRKSGARDPRIRPDHVIYDGRFTAGLAIAPSIQSLLNALAHPIAAVATESLEGADRTNALDAVGTLTRAAEQLVEAPAHRAARMQALRGTSAAGEALDRGKMGAHHSAAHRIGGRHDLPHAALHALLLPHSLNHLRESARPAFDAITEAAGVEDLPALLFDLLRRAGAETALSAFGVTGVEDVEFGWLDGALVGRRPSTRVRRLELAEGGGASAFGPAPEHAEQAVVAIGGPAALEIARTIVGDAPQVAIVAPDAAADAEDAGDWARTHIDPERVRAIDLTSGSPNALERVRLRADILGAAEAPRGFGNTHEVECLPGALPTDQNSPRKSPYGLYPEQINCSGFVAPRHENLRSWLYRIRPSAQHTRFDAVAHPTLGVDFTADPEPNLCGWAPLPEPSAPTDFVDGLHTVGGAGSPEARRGFAVHLYAANTSMEDRAFYSADGDLVLVPELGAVTLLTEFGVLRVAPGHIAVIPRGLRFSVLLEGDWARGYVGEIFARHFELPPRGPVGANGLTDARHFVAPTPWYEDRLSPGYRITARFGGALFEARQDHSPYDVVAWHGELTPYAYDLSMFSPVSNVRVDHGDPSMYTVLSAPLDEQGAHALDLVVFPARWDVTENTFRPPFFHRNITTEINGIVREPSGGHDGVFQQGMTFITPAMTPHGVVNRGVERAFHLTDEQADRPRRSTGASLWFQFETALPMRLTPWAAAAPNRIADWHDIWGNYRTHFRADRRNW
jgi:homogentisate 1,2-dioxygenase